MDDGIDDNHPGLHGKVNLNNSFDWVDGNELPYPSLCSSVKTNFGTCHAEIIVSSNPTPLGPQGVAIDAEVSMSRVVTSPIRVTSEFLLVQPFTSFFANIFNQSFSMQVPNLKQNLTISTGGHDYLHSEYYQISLKQVFMGENEKGLS